MKTTRQHVKSTGDHSSDNQRNRAIEDLEQIANRIRNGDLKLAQEVNDWVESY